MFLQPLHKMLPILIPKHLYNAFQTIRKSFMSIRARLLCLPCTEMWRGDAMASGTVDLFRTTTRSSTNYLRPFSVTSPVHKGDADPSHKSHNAPVVPYPILHHFVTEMCTRVHISVTKWCIAGYLSDAPWNLLNGSYRNWEMHGQAEGENKVKYLILVLG